MKKVLLINCVYGNGSTGKILKDLHEGLLANGWDSYVCFARGQANNDDRNVIKLASDIIFKFQSLFSRISGHSYACSPISTRRLKRIIEKIKPDIVNLHCVNANTLDVIDTLNYLKISKIPTVITCHAEFLYTGGCGHSLGCMQWIEGCKKCPQFKHPNSQLPKSWFFDKTSIFWKGLKESYHHFPRLRITAVSPWVKSRVIRSPFFNDRIISVTRNGIETSIFRPMDSTILRKRHDISSNARIYIHPTPNFRSPLKGGRYIIDFAQRLLDIDTSSKVIIIGYNGNGEKIPENVITIPRTSNQKELAMYYSLADVTLIASERETFSMVTAESLCCGTPVVGFKAGGPESICEYGHAIFVDYGDIDGFTKAALKIHKTSEISKIYSPIFSKKNMVSEYERVYKELI